MKKYYYIGGISLFICLGLLFLCNHLIAPDFSIHKDSSLWYFKFNQNFHREADVKGYEYTTYKFDKAPKVLFDIDIHDLNIAGGTVMLEKGKVCTVFFYIPYGIDEKLLDTILDRFRKSSLNKNLKEDYIVFGRTERIYFSSPEGERLIGVYIADDILSVNFLNVNAECKK